MRIKLTIDRFEGDQAVLITDNGTAIVWPKAKLPAGISSGAALIFNIVSDKNEEQNKKDLAKDILNEILNINP